MQGVKSGWKSIPAIILQNKTFCSNIDKAEALGQFFSGSGADIIKYVELEARTPQLANQFPVTTIVVQPLNSSLDLDFTLRELKQAIQKARNSAPGPDRLSFLMFKHLDDRVLDVILRFFNEVWALGKLPCDWKHSIVITILKDGKDSTAPSSYCPMRLSSFGLF